MSGRHRVDAYAGFFRALTENPPFAWQERLAEVMLSGRDVILRAPTGSGKTWAVVAPFLFALEHSILADRMLYALPLRSLAASLHNSTFKGLKRLGKHVALSGSGRDYGGGGLHCSLQIGGDKNDPYFESELVFTTIDQILSAYLLVPVSLPDRVGNVGAGALLGSLLVVDESHLLDSNVALGTLVELLDRVKGLSQFVVMTATMPDRVMNWLAGKLRAEAFRIPDEEIRALPGQRSKERTWEWAGRTLGAADVVAWHQGGRTVALVNTVKRAQTLYRDLEAAFLGSPTRVLLLHARFFPQDRKATENLLDAYFGPDADSGDVVLVTTQVIEAGIDISAGLLHTELAPMNALVQRAGRVARYAKRNQGRVRVYEPMAVHPYADDADLVERTRAILKPLPGGGRIVDTAEEERWVAEVHEEPELRQLERYRNLRDRRSHVHEAMNQQDRSKLQDLVRNVDSVSVVLTDAPEQLNFSGRDAGGKRIGWPRLLSLPRDSVMALSQVVEECPEREWAAKGAVDAGGAGVFRWVKVQRPGGLRAHWLLALHPSVARYDPRLGLALGQGGAAPAVEYTEAPPWRRYRYQFETWVDHAQRIVEEARTMSGSFRVGSRRLAQLWARDSEWVEELVAVACALHDAGKMAEAWQRVAWDWQRMKDAQAGVNRGPPVLVAHTTYDPKIDGLRRPLFPPHAAEGAYAAEQGVYLKLVADLGEDKGLLAGCALLSAMARHHGGKMGKLTLFHISPGAAESVASVLPAGWNVPLASCSDRLEAGDWGQTLSHFGTETGVAEWALFVYLVRRLRLADQRASSAGVGG